MFGIIHYQVNIIIFFPLQPVNIFKAALFPVTDDFFCTHGSKILFHRLGFYATGNNPHRLLVEKKVFNTAITAFLLRFFTCIIIFGIILDEKPVDPPLPMVN
jgi:hypothetical protein